MWEPNMTGATSSLPPRTPMMLPMASIVTVRPRSRIHCTSRSRPARSSSLSASRQLPPPGKAPMRLNASSRPSRRSRSIRGDVVIARSIALCAHSASKDARKRAYAGNPVHDGGSDADMNFGITLSNRGIPVGLCSARDLLALADAVEACPAMDSIWCGDALFVNRRLDALTLLAAVAGRTERVLLGPACMGSFALRNPLVFAYEWASLDVLSTGRTRLVVCAGGGAGPLWEAESAALNIAPGERRKRMIENIHVLRHLWTKDNQPFAGQFTQFSN